MAQYKKWSIITRLQRLVGSTTTINSVTVRVYERDESGNILRASTAGTVSSLNSQAGFAVGASLLKSNGGAGTSLYINNGSASSATFTAMTGLAPANGTITRTQMSADAGTQIAPTQFSAVIPTTGNVVAYLVAPTAGSLASLDLSTTGSLAASDTNYITFTLTNLGQAGSGTTVMLAATAANTTKATGGAALVAKAKYPLTVSGTAGNLVVAQGDVLALTATASGTLVGTVAAPIVLARFSGTT